VQIYIGYDSKEPVAYHVLAHSILTRSSIPVAIIPIALDNVKSFFTRKRGEKETTEFSISRFLVPYLSNYEGLSIFMDSDMLCLIDIAELVALFDRKKAIQVCQHDYEPKSDVKFLGQAQTKYPRKNWSSMIMFNNKKCRALSLDYVNNATGLELHRFMWTQDSLIGSLPLEYNWLVGEYEPKQAKILHYTLGGYWFEKDCELSAVWLEELKKMTRPL